MSAVYRDRKWTVVNSVAIAALVNMYHAKSRPGCVAGGCVYEE